jgi:hypothetical protein
MKTLLACLCLLCVSTFADEGPPPQPTGDKSRFTVVSGQVDHGSGPVATFMRVDTFTGQTWICQQVPIPGGRGAMLNVWIPSHEVGSDVYDVSVKAIQGAK